MASKKGYEHLLQRAHAKFRGTISQGSTLKTEHQCQCKNLWGTISHKHTINMIKASLSEPKFNRKLSLTENTKTWLKTLVDLFCILYLRLRLKCKRKPQRGSSMAPWYICCYYGYCFGLIWLCSERDRSNKVESLFQPTCGNRGDGTANDLACLMWT